jgi:hypothetical protein
MKQIWIDKADGVEDFTDVMGKHLVALPFGRQEEKFGGLCIGADPNKQTTSIRRYDTGEVRQFDWFTTRFMHSTEIETPYVDLEVGAVRRFEWWLDEDGYDLTEARELVGTVDAVDANGVCLWVKDKSWPGGGWWARLRNEDAPRHALRPVLRKKRA